MKLRNTRVHGGKKRNAKRSQRFGKEEKEDAAARVVDNMELHKCLQ